MSDVTVMGRAPLRVVVVAAAARACSRGAVVAIVLLTVACGRGGAPPARAELHAIRGQNVLLITIDTLRADALGVYGGRAATPALDRLAAEGVRFDFAHAHAVVTLPSHASILTGRYPFEHGVRDNSGYRLPADIPTLATRLKEGGYATGAFVAAFPLHSRFGLGRGFDVYDDRFGETHAPTEFVMPERPATAVVALARAWIGTARDAASAAGGTGPVTAAPGTAAGITARGTTARGTPAPSTAAPGPASPSTAAPATGTTAPSTTAPGTMAPGTTAPAPNTHHPSPGTHPWFLWLHVFDPHAPYRPPPPFEAQYAGRPYDGEVAATDAALAPLLDDVRNGERPTLVVVTADHGESLGEHGEQAHGLFAYEATLRVPLIVAELGGRSAAGARVTNPTRVADGTGPSSGAGASSATGASAATPATGGERTEGTGASRETRGTGSGTRGGDEVSSVLARHVDILPTVLEAVGLAVPSDLPGRSLLTGTQRDRAAPSPSSYFEAMSGLLNRGAAPLTGVLVDREKLIVLPIAERYDLASDPGERVNLAGRAPDRDRTLAGVLRGYKAPPPGARTVETPDALARLRALGYVSGSAPPKKQFTEDDDPKRLVELEADVHRAVEAYGAGRLGDAVEIYQRVIARRPDFALASRHLAFLEARRGNVGGAIDVLQRAVARGATQPEIVTELAGYLTDAGRTAQAIQMLEPLAADPLAGADTLNTLGIAYARAGQRDAAKRTFTRVLAVNPASSVPLENLGMLALESGDVAAARQHFTRAVAAEPRSSQAHAGLGTAALRSGDRTTAIAEWTRAVQLDSRNLDALFNLGTTLARSGDTIAARPYLEQFLRTAPPSYDADRRVVSQLLRP